MIGMGVRQQDRVDLRRLNAREQQSGLQSAAPLLEAARTCVYQNRAAASAHQIAVDMDRGMIRYPCFFLHTRGVNRVDVREKIETGMEIAITDGSDRQVTDLMVG
jgi:hypothetical protein